MLAGWCQGWQAGRREVAQWCWRSRERRGFEELARLALLAVSELRRGLRAGLAQSGLAQPRSARLKLAQRQKVDFVCLRR